MSECTALCIVLDCKWEVHEVSAGSGSSPWLAEVSCGAVFLIQLDDKYAHVSFLPNSPIDIGELKKKLEMRQAEKKKIKIHFPKSSNTIESFFSNCVPPELKQLERFSKK